MGSPQVLQLHGAEQGHGLLGPRPEGPPPKASGTCDTATEHRPSARTPARTPTEMLRNALKETHFIQKESVGDLTAVMEPALFTWPFSFSEMFFQTDTELVSLCALGLCLNTALSRSSSISSLTTFLKIAIHPHTKHPSYTPALGFPAHCHSLTYCIIYCLTLPPGTLQGRNLCLLSIGFYSQY